MKNTDVKKTWVRRLGEPFIPLLVSQLVLLSPAGAAVDVGAIRKGLTKSTSTAPVDAAAETTQSGVLPSATVSLTSSNERLAKATAAVLAAKKLQDAARTVAQNGANNLKPNLPSIAAQSFGIKGGLKMAAGVPKNLTSVTKTEDASLWTGAELPTVAIDTSNQQVVTIAQKQQQAVLNWETFNVGKSTTVHFDQTLGGADAGEWVAFNKVGISGSPSQILGTIKAEGQVYVINPNGILFGGSSQVNAHALVASSLPINDNLISRGLLNNPDSQFLFSAFSQQAGANGTPSNTPIISDLVSLGSSPTALVLEKKVASTSEQPTVSFTTEAGRATLDPQADFSTAVQSDGKTKLTFTASGIQKLKTALEGTSALVSYTPAASQYGNVEVQAGAILTAPTSAEHVGGRIALVGPNVSNAGTLRTPDGQTLLAAGLEVGFAAHQKTDPSLRGLDVYVGKVADADTPDYLAGTASNDAVSDGNGGIVRGVIDTTDETATSSVKAARPGSISLTGREVKQLGLINTVTSVSTNGRIDLNASYNAYGNVDYKPTDEASQPFLYKTGDSTGSVLLGAGSLTQIMPSQDTSDKVAGTAEKGLTLRSQINVTGKRLHLQSTGTGVNDEDVAQVRAPNATVKLNAGTWAVIGAAQKISQSHFVYDKGEIYLDKGAAIDVGGTQAAAASVKDNYTTAQLNSSELADSPNLRDSAIKGSTVTFDIRNHGAWDASLNNGQGGYTWVGSQVADLSGWVGLVQRTAEQLTTNAGTVDFHAGNAVVINQGASVNVSGGWTTFKEDYVPTTTKLVGENGKIYDLSVATSALKYKGIYDGTTTTTSSKWGTTTTSVDGLAGKTTLESGYLQGGNGGTLSVTAGSVALDGSFNGQTQNGYLQTAVKPTAGRAALVALPSSFSLKLQSQRLDTLNLNTAEGAIHTYSPNTPDVVLGATNTLATSSKPDALPTSSDKAYTLSEARRDRVELSTDLVNSQGFGFLTIDAGDDAFGVDGRGAAAGKYGNVIVAAQTNGTSDPVLNFGPASAIGSFLNAQYGSSYAALSLTGANVVINGNIRAPGSPLVFKATNVSASRKAITTSPLDGEDFLPVDVAVAGRGKVTVASGVSLDASGSILDFRKGTTGVAVANDGGSVSLQGYQVTLNSGNVVDVSGGVVVGSGSSSSYGSAGKIEVKALNEENFDGARLFMPASFLGASDTAAFRGYGSGTGGEFSLQAPLLQVGGKALTDRSLMVASDFFSRGGFSKFTLTGQNDGYSAQTAGLQLGSLNSDAAAVVIAPTVQSHYATFSDTSGVTFSTYVPDASLAAPVSLTFRALGDSSSALTERLPGSLIFGANVSIQTPANRASSVTLAGETVDLLSRDSSSTTAIKASGGTISISGLKDTTAIPSASTVFPATTVHVGKNVVLDAAGSEVTRTDGYGTIRGNVLAGGKITLFGNVLAESGSVLDVSGSTGTLDYAQAQVDSQFWSVTNSLGYIRKILETDAGTITLDGGQFLLSDATLVGEAGGVSATGGTLKASSGLFLTGGVLAKADVPTLRLDATGSVLDAKLAYAAGKAVKDKDGNYLSMATEADTGTKLYGGSLSTKSFASGGFANLNFGGSVEAKGAVSLSATRSLKIASGGVILANKDDAKSSLTLSAPYVALGTAFSDPSPTGAQSGLGNVTPTHGTGSLTVTNANLIDVGNLSLSNIGKATLSTVSAGDIRGLGTFDLSGALRLEAGQVYVPTASTFSIGAYDYLDSKGVTQDGSITVVAKGKPSQVPLSAGGQLNLFASTLEQGGVLRAPLGGISLGGGENTVDLNTGGKFQKTKTVTLKANSVTSVSTVDLVTGKAITIPIPYGVLLNGTAWIDPTGTDISVSGPAAKRISINGDTVNVEKDAQVDVSGGGDLYAYRFTKGTTGTVDILNAYRGSFAVLPDYTGDYSPFAGFASSQSNLAGDPGYVNLDPTTKASTLNPGDKIYLDLDGKGVKAYTLLPARYALLPGALLVSPSSASTTNVVSKVDGSKVVRGYRFNSYDSATTLNPVYSAWEVASGTVVRARAKYDEATGNSYFPTSATANNVATPRLSRDAGQIVFSANTALTFKGTVNAATQKDDKGNALGLGGLVDIESPQDIVISGSNASASDTSGKLVLNAGDLSNFEAESLLIGGTRKQGSDGLDVTVTAASVTVDNGTDASSTLKGSDLLLVANREVTVAENATIVASGTVSGGAQAVHVTGKTSVAPGETVSFGAENASLVIAAGSDGALLTSTAALTLVHDDGTQESVAAGTAFTAKNKDRITFAADASAGASLSVDPASSKVSLLTGDGAALRVSADPAAQVLRSGVAQTSYQKANGAVQAPSVTVLNGASINAATGSATFDSTAGISIAGVTDSKTSSTLKASTLGFQTRGVSVAFDASPARAGDFVVPLSSLTTWQAAGLQSLSLSSYTTIDVLGSGTFGGTGLKNLSLHSAALVQKGTGAAIFQAGNLRLDNAAGGKAGSAPQTTVGSIALKALDSAGKGTLTLGGAGSSSALSLDGFRNVAIEAGTGVVLQGNGGLNARGGGANGASLTITAPTVTAQTGAKQLIASSGSLTLLPSASNTTSTLESGLGATLTLEGTGITAASNLSLPSGSLTLHATSGDVKVSGRLSAIGAEKLFNDVYQYTNGGTISLRSDSGIVEISKEGILDVSAAQRSNASDGSRRGNAGTVSIAAANSASGAFVVNGSLLGKGGTSSSTDAVDTRGNGGSFVLDVGSLGETGTSWADFNRSLDAGGFTLSRSVRVRAGDVTLDGTASAHQISVSADAGTVRLKGLLDASGSLLGKVNTSGSTYDLFGNQGGTVSLTASGSVLLEKGSRIDASGLDFSTAGKGGLVSLSAGASVNGAVDSTALLDLRDGSTIDLSVTNANAQSASLGKVTGVLHLRAPQNADASDLAIADGALKKGKVVNASSIEVEGFAVYRPEAGLVDSVRNAVKDNGAAFLGGLDSSNNLKTGHLSDIRSRLVAGEGSVSNDSLHFQVGAEIVNAADATKPITVNLPEAEGAQSVTIAPGDAYRFAASTGANFDAGEGTLVTLTNPGNSGSTLQLSANQRIAFPSGTPGAAKVKASKAGSLINPDGTTTTFKANASFSVPAGAYLVLDAPGKVTYTSGAVTNPIPVLLTAGNYTLTGDGLLSNSAGSLALANAWDLSTYRFGSSADVTKPGSGEAGVLTLRASGNLSFNYGSYNSTTKTLAAGSLSDGFTTGASGGLWQATLLTPGSRSWSYNLISGADFTAADTLSVVSASTFGAENGSLLLGANASPLKQTQSTLTATAIIPQYFQTLRTGTGDITIRSAKDVRLINPLATIYTAGTQVASATSVNKEGDFDLPNTWYNKTPGSFGLIQLYSPSSNVYQAYTPQYSYLGGNVSLAAGNDIVRINSDGSASSSAEMPTNWLYRRGSVASDGTFAVVNTKDNVGGSKPTSEVASTSWWTDFTNFFQDIGTFGGGNVTLNAGRNVTNVSASVATNARASKSNDTGNLASKQTLLELGGGNVTVRAGGDIDGGVYYVEKGAGNLSSGASIKTNATRTTLLNAQSLLSGDTPVSETTWLPTTLFLGKGSFNVSANGDVLLGSVANPFLLPQGINNSFYQRTFFSTFDSSSSVSVSSLIGDVTLRGSKQGSIDSSLFAWYNNQLSFLGGSAASLNQPWLRLIETGASGSLPNTFLTMADLYPGTLKVTSFGNSINLASDLTLAPSARGTIDLLASGSVNGLLPHTIGSATELPSSTNPYQWLTATVNLSDASPDRIPSALKPLAYSTSTSSNQKPLSPVGILDNVVAIFQESGATAGSNVVLQTQLALHGARPDDSADQASHALHGGDTTPVHIYAAEGDVSGFTLYSAKSARVNAGTDISDVGLYIQNVNTSDITVVSAGRDILPYDLNSPLRLKALSQGDPSAQPAAQSGDIQIGGPGSLEVFAGRDLTLGAAVSGSNGISEGIATIGKTRNPYLPYAGADVLVGAGISTSGTLGSSDLDLTSFVNQFLNPLSTTADTAAHLKELGLLMGYTKDGTTTTISNEEIWNVFSTSLPKAERDRLALEIFFATLRDAGQNRNNPDSPHYGDYNEGYQAIASLFGKKINDAGTTSSFTNQFLNPAVNADFATKYLPLVGTWMKATATSAEALWTQFQALTESEQKNYAFRLFTTVLSDAAAARRTSSGAESGKKLLDLALAALFSEQRWKGSIALNSRVVKTTHGGNISVLAPGGGLSLGNDLASANQAPPGIVTEHGGNISIFTHKDVDVGVERIFTLRGGNEIVWSSTGNIAAGKSSKTVQAAPPTEVLVDPQSANVKTDLAGLATGGGIGVLTSVAGAAKGNIDLIAPAGAVDAGEAGIQASGNLNIAADIVLNAGNIKAGGSVAGTPQAPAAPSVGTLTSASSVSAAATTSTPAASRQATASNTVAITPSVISVEILGYGGDSEEEETQEAPSSAS